MTFILRSVILVACVVLGACTSESALPQSADKVQFGVGNEGHVGWSSYREEATFPGVDRSRMIEAAKAGLGSADFVLKRVDPAGGVVTGEHGMTWFDWNIVAGVYMKPSANGTIVVVLAEGSKDVGFTGDATAHAWPAKILQGMRAYLGEPQVAR